MSVAIADTSFVVALANQRDQQHEACNQVKQQIETMLLLQSVLAEVGYMLGRELGNPGVVYFLRNLPKSKYRPVALESKDFIRAADILEQYADSRLDFVDATVVAVAEDYKISQILTLDRRDFGMVRPNHIAHFELLPQP